MTTLIFDWSELLGQDATGVVRVRATRWRHEPETLVVPWSRDLRFTGREVLEVDAGLVLAVEWRPKGVAGSLAQTLVVPASGEHFAHLLAVDPSTLDPLEGDDLLRAQDILDQAQATLTRADGLQARIESGEFTGEAGADGADGVGVESITDDDGDGVATVRLTSGEVSDLLLPRGPQGERGERGLTGDRGEVGPAPDVSWAGDRLTVGGQTGPSLTGPQGEKGDRGDTGATGPANSLTIGTVQSGATADATLTGEAPAQTLSLVLPKGATGDRGPQGIQGPPGVVSSASAYVIVGPGRPDVPSTTAGAISGAEPVGAEYRSTDGAGVGAFVWMKRPGGAWEVTDGDTGWRAIPLEGAQHSTTTVAVRRLANLVLLRATVVPNGSVSFRLATLPAGFQAWTSPGVDIKGGVVSTPISHGASGSSVGELRLIGNALTVENLTTNVNRHGAQMIYAASDHWPTTLPGSPA